MKGFNPKKYDKMFELILKLETIEECREFFVDVCTIKELEDISQRLEVAKLLDEGKNYQEVVKATGASTATISRVNKCLMYGTGGYKRVLDKKVESNE